MGSLITEVARGLRRKQTPAEKIFWDQVRNRGFLNKKFSRQFPIPVFIDGKKRFFIADFYCFELQLVIEIDGLIHEKQKEYDQTRTQILNSLGMKIIRFSNQEVLANLDNVLKKLKKEIAFPSLKERG